MKLQLNSKPFVAKLLIAQEAEREMLAHELHDDLCQRLAAIVIEAGVLEKHLEGGASYEKLKRIKQELVNVAKDTHTLSHRLLPAMLSEFGLKEALRHEVEETSSKSDISIAFAASTVQVIVHPQIELMIFRIAQESIANAMQHSSASHIQVNLMVTPEKLTLQIEDNGSGFAIDAIPPSSGIGLQMMRERAKLIEAKLYFRSQPAHGTTVELILKPS
ncbi:sensor histidine kinase [Vibrio maritimus]|uniref:histidine kinase n=1 Tax=Vibrio maritimus TaxID=990268 RepID=A0A090SZP9_9VIBR|nr:sensor histidine kinase [Vibrio maritimus]